VFGVNRPLGSEFVKGTLVASGNNSGFMPAIVFAVLGLALYLMFGGGVGGVKSFQSTPLPAIHTNPAATWLNSDGPISLESLKGKVVWLEFSFLH